MQLVKKRIQYYLHESKWFFLIRFTSVFLFLYACFVFFIGIAMPGGLIENQFLYEHFNLISYYTHLVNNTVVQSLRWMGIEAWRNGPINIKTAFGGVNIIYACLAIGVHCIWIAFVIAIKNSTLKKVLWISIGSIMLFVLNIIRIVLILLGNLLLKTRHWKLQSGL